MTVSTVAAGAVVALGGGVVVVGGVVELAGVVVDRPAPQATATTERGMRKAPISIRREILPKVFFKSLLSAVNGC